MGSAEDDYINYTQGQKKYECSTLGSAESLGSSTKILKLFTKLIKKKNY
jgi:hypothetical protein